MSVFRVKINLKDKLYIKKSRVTTSYKLFQTINHAAILVCRSIRESEAIIAICLLFPCQSRRLFRVLKEND
jgi:hypothetical protein